MKYSFSASLVDSYTPAILTIFSWALDGDKLFRIILQIAYGHWSGSLIKSFFKYLNALLFI